jgi:predicted ATPase
VLLVLDNFEHLPLAAPEIAAILAGAPRVQILATSRAPLKIQWERLYSVSPLPAQAAVDLFRQRAAQVTSSIRSTDEEVVAGICSRLDFLPLAIELAAARSRLLPPAALLARLNQAITLLTGGPPDLPERQQALSKTIAWSYDLLSDAERTLFRRLAVLAGGWTLDAAASVADLSEVTSLDLQIRQRSWVARAQKAASEPVPLHAVSPLVLPRARKAWASSAKRQSRSIAARSPSQPALAAGSRHPAAS